METDRLTPVKYRMVLCKTVLYIDLELCHHFDLELRQPPCQPAVELMFVVPDLELEEQSEFVELHVEFEQRQKLDVSHNLSGPYHRVF